MKTALYGRKDTTAIYRYLGGNTWQRVEWVHAADDLKYHTSWDWLMPVVEKIESLNDDIVDKVWVSINGKSCGLWTYFDVKEVLRIGAENNKFKVSNTNKSKIEATWATVIDFIQWYNTQPNNKDNGSNLSQNS